MSEPQAAPAVRPLRAFRAVRAIPAAPAAPHKAVRGEWAAKPPKGVRAAKSPKGVRAESLGQVAAEWPVWVMGVLVAPAVPKVALVEWGQAEWEEWEAIRSFVAMAPSISAKR